MANTYTWSINALDCIPSADGQTNVVSNVHWIVTATSTETHTLTNYNNTTSTVPYSSSAYGTQSLTYTEGNPFTPYDGLTQDTVIEWVKTAMGSEQIASIKTSLDNQIANLINPPIVTPPLPWVKT